MCHKCLLSFVYHHLYARHKTKADFREKLAWSLIGSYNSRQRAGRHRCSGVQQPTPTPISFHSSHHHQRQRCVYCRHYHHPPCRRESVWQYLVCEGSPTLCLTGKDDGSDCWALWHAEPRWRPKQRSDDLCILSPLTYIYIISILHFITLSTQELIIISANMEA